ncbi:hypothetical protein pb186bvf_001017 [Paramecium bursaria]
MVTFVCYNCNQTLKKPQAEKHLQQCRKPAKFVCIDCKKYFNGDEHIQHTQCLTEKQLYWGQYANQMNGKPTQQKEQQKPEEVKVNQEEQQEIQWPGWRNFINQQMIKLNKSQIKLIKLEKIVYQEYIKIFPDCDKEEFRQNFTQKIKQSSKFSVEPIEYVIKKVSI